MNSRISPTRAEVSPRAVEEVSTPDAGLRCSSCGADPTVARERPQARYAVGGLLDPPMDRREAASETTLADRDRVLAIFAHDLSNLLTVLSLNAELFLERRGGTAANSAGNMRRAIGRMDRLISSLLDLSKLNAGKLHVTPEPRDAAEVLREAVEMFRPVAFAKSVALTLVGAEGPLPAKIDRDRIFQVLSNLLSNAIKFTPRTGEILVSAVTIGGVVQVEVRDTGTGIPEDDLARVFECYRQLDGSGRDGLGLGLFISKAIIQAHGGRIWATSGAEGGSVFLFTIPAAGNVSRPAPSSALSLESVSQ